MKNLWRVLWVWIWRGEILDDRVSDRWRLEHARLVTMTKGRTG